MYKENVITQDFPEIFLLANLASEIGRNYKIISNFANETKSKRR